MRGGSESKAHMPRTLAEAFAASTGTTLEGNLLSDDAEEHIQHFGNRLNRSLRDTGDLNLEVDMPQVMKDLCGLEGSELGACHAARVTKTGSNVPAVMLTPSD